LSLPFSRFIAPSLLAAPLILTGCGGGSDSDSSSSIVTTNPAGVYFAQTHVITPDYVVPGTQSERFRLISNREALFKAQILSIDGKIPTVAATLELNGNAQALTLTPAETHASSFDSGLGKVQHRKNDSYTGVIPASWVQPGLVVKLKVDDKETVYDDLYIGASNPVTVNLFEIDVFNAGATELTNYPTDWEKEAASKFPVSEFNINRVSNIHFSEITVPPTGSQPATKIDSIQAYEDANGVAFSQHNSSSHPWAVALRMAAGTHGGLRHSLTAVGYYFPQGTPKGLGGGYTLTAKRVSGAIGILIHELGHTMSLPHWGNNPSAYPYVGRMYGINSPGIYGDVHAGPTWAYDPPSATFIPPTIQDTVDGSATPGTYKKDPMQGGALGHQEKGFMFGHFSDFSVHRMARDLENKWVVFNSDLNAYAKWSQTDEAYTDEQSNNGVHFPITPNVQVYSVMAGASSKTAAANIVYPVIGPYTSGLIQLFDPKVAADRAAADEVYCPTDGCDVSLEIVQNGTTKTYMLAIALDTSLEETDSKSFITRALNLPASDGEITSVKLMATPNAEIGGYPVSPSVLATWAKS